MTRPLLALALLLGAIHPPLTHAQVPLGTHVATFTYAANKVLADPIRARIYVADPHANSVMVIDTVTLKLLAAIPTGPDPVDMAIAADGSVLYVANHESSTQAVTAISPGSLTVARTFALPGYPKAITLNGDTQVYVAASPDPLSVQSSIYQLDGTTGVVQRTFNTSDTDNDFLQFGPDGSSLYVASVGNFDEDDDSYSGTFEQFDTSTTPPAFVADNDTANQLAVQLVLSSTGKYLALPGNAGNSSFVADQTSLFLPGDITDGYLSFSNGQPPGPLAFSPDDSRVYQTLLQSDPTSATNTLQVFDTQTLDRVSAVTFPALIKSSVYSNIISSIVSDNTGSYLFIGESVVLGVGADGEYTTADQLVVVGTGAGTLTPPTSSGVPMVTLAATIPSVTEGSGNVGQFTLTLSAVQSHDLTVNLKIKGAAIDGTDYALIADAATIKAGATTQQINIIPEGDLEGAPAAAVKLKLEPGTGYTAGTTGKVKVKILAGE